MYLAHYGLTQKPFQISPDPKFLWLGEAHREALAMMNYGIRDNRGLLMLSGDVGTGKTTLINRLLESLDEDVIVATIPDPGLEKLDFYNFLTRAFAINKTFNSKGDFLVYFIHFLHNAHNENKHVLIVIDEAQRLTHEMLEEVRQLANIEKKDTKLLNIFLVGQNELLDNLTETRNRALLQRITTRFNIDPLKANEVEDYIRFRLNKAGTQRKLFTAAAVKQIARASDCYPRLINIMCDHALLTGYVKGKKTITAAIARESINDLSINSTAEKHRVHAGVEGVAQERPRGNGSSFLSAFPATVGIVVLLLLCIAGLFYFNVIDRSLFKRPSTTPPSPSRVKTFTLPPQSEDSLEDAFAAPGGAHDAQPSLSDTLLNDNARREPEAPATGDVLEPLPPPPDEIFTIRFPMNSNAFTDAGYQTLNELVDIVRQYPELQVIISGHTDSSGDYAYNKRLSTFRANVVKRYFVGQGVDPERIETIGMGPDKPIKSNASAEGRQANRRVEIELQPPQHQ